MGMGFCCCGDNSQPHSSYRSSSARPPSSPVPTINCPWCSSVPAYATIELINATTGSPNANGTWPIFPDPVFGTSQLTTGCIGMFHDVADYWVKVNINPCLGNGGLNIYGDSSCTSLGSSLVYDLFSRTCSPYYVELHQRFGAGIIKVTY